MNLFSTVMRTDCCCERQQNGQVTVKSKMKIVEIVKCAAGYRLHQETSKWGTRKKFNNIKKSWKKQLLHLQSQWPFEWEFQNFVQRQTKPSFGVESNIKMLINLFEFKIINRYRLSKSDDMRWDFTYRMETLNGQIKILQKILYLLLAHADTQFVRRTEIVGGQIVYLNLLDSEEQNSLKYASCLSVQHRTQ